MNIFFLNSIDRDTFGGGEKWMVHAADSLGRKGHKVTVAGRAKSKFLEYAAKQGLRNLTIEIGFDFNPVKILTIARLIAKCRIDALICNTKKDLLAAGLAARIAGKPVVLARHGIPFRSRKWKHRFALVRLCDGIITNSETIRQEYAGYKWIPPDFVTVLYNGLTIPEQITAIDFTKRFPGKKIIYSAGRLTGQKGFEYLIGAAAILREKRDDLVFVVSGEGRLNDELKQLARSSGLAESFVFDGFTPDIYPYLKGCDLFVLASLFEGMPNVVMEAMAAEKAVIATDVNGARELMQEGETGVIVPPADSPALAEAIGSVIDRPGQLLSFGKAGKNRVEEHFTTDKMADRLEAHLLEKIEKKQATSR